MAGKNKINKHYHSLVGRRDFIKVLGMGALATAGNSFGITFHDVLLQDITAAMSARRFVPSTSSTRL